MVEEDNDLSMVLINLHHNAPDALETKATSSRGGSRGSHAPMVNAPPARDDHTPHSSRQLKGNSSGNSGGSSSSRFAFNPAPGSPSNGPSGSGSEKGASVNGSGHGRSNCGSTHGQGGGSDAGGSDTGNGNGANGFGCVGEGYAPGRVNGAGNGFDPNLEGCGPALPEMPEYLQVSRRPTCAICH